VFSSIVRSDLLTWRVAIFFCSNNCVIGEVQGIRWIVYPLVDVAQTRVGVPTAIFAPGYSKSNSLLTFGTKKLLNAGPYQVI
jgi:hypothetical protein